MSGASAGQQELVASLRRYTSYLEERNAAVTELLRSSENLCSHLRNDPSSDIDAVLNQRENHCRRFVELADTENKTDASAVVSLRGDATETSDELRALTSGVESLQAQCQSLTQSILVCQSECEAILRGQLQATAHALRQSVHRRKLDAAYGPACKRQSPVFLDRER